jgi:hypothetical protein
MFRFNGLHYPLISLLVIGFTHLPRKEKKIGIGSIVLLLLTFIGRTQYEYQQQTGTVQIATAPGWQLAVNALHVYAQTTPTSAEHMRGRFWELNTIVSHHLDSLQIHHADIKQDRFYFWNAKSPLIAYMNKRFKHDSTTLFARQAKIATIYSNYCWHLITIAPGSFLKNYICPNMIKYFVPPSGTMDWNNHDDRTVTPVIAKWFGWKNNKTLTQFENNKIKITKYLAIVAVVFNMVFVLGSLTFLNLTGFKRTTLFSSGIAWPMTLIWFSNFVVSIWASPIELRHQLFSMLMTGMFDVLLISWIIQGKFAMAIVNGKSENSLPQPII